MEAAACPPSSGRSAVNARSSKSEETLLFLKCFVVLTSVIFRFAGDEKRLQLQTIAPPPPALMQHMGTMRFFWHFLWGGLRRGRR